MVTRHPRATCRTLQGRLVFQIRSKGGQREPREDASHLLTSGARRRRSWSRGLNKPSDYSPRERRRRGWADQGWRRRFQKAARAQPPADHLVGRPSWGPVASRHPGTAVQPPASASLREGEERQRRQRGGSWGRCGRGWGQRRAERCRAGRTRPRPACPPHILARALSAHLWLPQRQALTSPASVAPRRSQSVLPVIEPPACPPVDLRVSVWSPRAAALPGHTGAATNAPLLGIVKRRLCKPPLWPREPRHASPAAGAPLTDMGVARRSPGPGQRAKEPREQVSVHTRCSRLQYLHQRRWGASPQPSGREVLMTVRLKGEDSSSRIGFVTQLKQCE